MRSVIAVTYGAPKKKSERAFPFMFDLIHGSTKNFFVPLTVVVIAICWSSLIPADAKEGVTAEILGVRIPADLRPVVTFRIADSKDLPLELKDIDEERLQFTISVIQEEKNGSTRYHNYVLAKVSGHEYRYKGERKSPAIAETLQPDVERGGVLSRQTAGVFVYSFRSSIPADYDRNATHVVGGEISRENGRYVANPLFEFVPSGATVKIHRAVVETGTCNNCHDPLKYHGGTRRAVGYCALCHTSQLIDPETGESLEFKVLVHKIHRGKLLPSVKEGKALFFVGENQKVADYTNLRYTQVVMSEGVARDLRNCNACHSGAKEENWKRFPGIAACTSCHNNVDLVTGKNHPAGPQSEQLCFACHPPEGSEFGPSIAGAHTYPGWSTQLPGVVFDIVKIENTGPGEHPTVTFSVKNKKGKAVDAGKVENLRLVVAWPTTDYKLAVEEDARQAEAKGAGIYEYTFKYVIPTEASGSGAIGIQGYQTRELKKPNGSIIKNVRDTGYNVVKYFPITDKEAVPRRQAIKIEK